MPHTAPDGYNVSCCHTTLRVVGDKCRCGASEIRDGDMGFPTMRITHQIADRSSFTITAVYNEKGV